MVCASRNGGYQNYRYDRRASVAAELGINKDWADWKSNQKKPQVTFNIKKKPENTNKASFSSIADEITYTPYFHEMVRR